MENTQYIFIELINEYSCSSIIFGKWWPSRIWLRADWLRVGWGGWKSDCNEFISAWEIKEYGQQARLLGASWVKREVEGKGISYNANAIRKRGMHCWYCCNGGDSRMYMLMEGSMRRERGGRRREGRTGQLPEECGQEWDSESRRRD